MVAAAIVCLAVSTVTALRVAARSRGSDTSNVRVSVTNISAGLPLEVVQRSPNAGFIQIPGWEYGTSLPKIMNSIVKVQVPSTHTAMITVLQVNFTGKDYKCDPSRVTLKVFATSMTEANIVWKCLWKPVQRQFLSQGANLYVRFQSGESRTGGFRLFFTVTDSSTTLREIEAGMWNCSVANFAEFKSHFPCDLYPQCINQEDERDCPYFSEDCGLGFADFGSRCLLFEKEAATGTWRDIQFLCNMRGGTLVNIRTREDYGRLVQYLQPLADIWRIPNIMIGMHSALKSLPFMYRQEFQHTDKTIAFDRSVIIISKVKYLCGLISQHTNVSNVHFLTACKLETPRNRVLCEFKKPTAKKMIPVYIKLHSVTNSNHSLLHQLLRCPLGHATFDFLACDLKSACWKSRDGNPCSAPLTPLPPSFTCANGVEHVPYTLICDVRSHCSDGSDETFCVFPPCDVPEPFHCSEHECVPRKTLCDGQKNCHNAADEELCSNFNTRTFISPSPPAIVHLNEHGQFTVHKMTQSQLAELSPAVCPETHFQCPGNSYCIPVFLRCNDVYDCLGWEDEMGCDSYICQGFYRCRSSRVCVHPQQLCDGIFQCPQDDDELLCDRSCPMNCTCYGLAFYCRHTFEAGRNLRFLDARNSGIKISDVKDNIMLIYLSVARNGLTTVGELNFPNLRNLDFSDNQLKEIYLHDFNRLPRLETMSLSGNPLQSLFYRMDFPESQNGIVFSKNIDDKSLNISKENTVVQSLRMMDLSRVQLKVFNSSFLSMLPNLHTVNMSGGGMDTLLGEGFQALRHLRALDLRGCPLTYFPRDIFLGLKELETVYSDNMKICCPATLPAGFVLKNCHAPSDDISSCDALLKFSIYRIFLSVFASLALLGNASSFFYRVFVQKRKRLLSFDVFVVHLSVSDFLMGVYLSVIGLADRLYQDSYLWEDNKWINSTGCHIAGFLSLVSSEVSALVICLITVDRFLVLSFPFSTFHFGSRSSHIASLCVWVAVCLISAVPFAPVAASWQFYSQTGICIPLPISRADFPGYAYAFGVIIVVNFILFVVTAGGQVFIYISVHYSFLSSDTSRKSQDITIARRLITVAMSDFLCWFPIGLAGLLAATGTHITGEVNVAMAIFVLPFNSALNPFLYTLNLVLESRRKSIEERLMTRFKSEITKQIQV